MPKIPRFTPDPAPDGLDPELAEWLQRQLNRIEDWWPKDLEDRLAYLEGLFPYVVGVWPIIGQSLVQFLDVQVVDSVEDCAQSVGYDSGGTQGALNIYNVDYSSTLGLIAMSGDGNNSLVKSIIVFRESDASIIWSLDGCTRSGHKIVSTPGTQDEKLVAVLEWPCGGSTRTLYYFDMTNNFSITAAVSLGNINTAIRAERDQDVILTDGSDPNKFWLSEKGTTNLTNLQIDGPWLCINAAAFNPAGGVPDRYLCCVKDGATFGFSEYFDQASVPAPVVTLGNIGGTPETLMTNPIVVGNSVWWVFSITEDSRAFLVETDFAGNQIRSIPQFDTNNYKNTRTGFNAIQYQASNNSLYYSYIDTLWRYSLTDQIYHTCDAPIDPFFNAITEGRSSSFVRIGNNNWDAIINYDANTKWGYEKIESGF